MLRYFLIRIIQSIITLFILVCIVFTLVRVSSDPAALMLSETATKEEYEFIKKDLGLDKPIYMQFGVFISKAITGDFGESVRTKRPVKNSIIEVLPNSIKLIAVTILITALLSVPLGVAAALNKGKSIDMIVRIIAGLGQSVPTFWVGLLMIYIFVVSFNLLPASGIVSWKSYIMPSSCLSIYLMSGIIRLLRSSLLEILDCDFIMLARVKGISERKVIWKHALRNSMLSIVSFGGMYIAILVTGAILVETVFAWPGFGRLAYTAITNQDFPLIQGVVITSGAIVMASNLLTDILYAYLDPRIRY